MKTSKISKLVNLTVISSMTMLAATSVLACNGKNHKCHCHHKCHEEAVFTNDNQQPIMKDMPVYTFMPNWYVGAHIGESRAHDRPTAGLGSSVTQIGPGWTADIGYQFYQFRRATFAGELGYTQYHQSSDNTKVLNIANTEHYATYLAGVGQYSLNNNFSVLGKLGLAYSYAKKILTIAGVTGSANAYSLYWGLGVTYYMTPRAGLVLQWARACGNNKTGSTDLASLGVTFGL